MSFIRHARYGRLGLPLAILATIAILTIATHDRASAVTVPNDPQYPSQWAAAKVKADQAWDVTRGSTAVKIAVLDTGVNPLPDLNGQLAPGYNALTPGGSTADDFSTYGSGTQIAGIIGAATNNGLDMTGIVWNASILPVKVCDRTGSCPAAVIANGINWATGQGAQVIHISPALALSSPELDAAVANALAQGRIIVAAVGNVNSRVGYPAAIPGVLAVGAVNSADVVGTFSGTGSGVDLVAPGESILTLVSGGCCLTRTGTEHGTAHVTGALALLLAAGISPASAVNAVLQGAQDLGPQGWDSSYGRGRLDICRALVLAGRACGGTAATSTPQPPTSTPQPPTSTPPPATASPTPTRTNTPLATATRTNTPLATATRTNTPLPPATFTPTRTATPRPPTATPTECKGNGRKCATPEPGTGCTDLTGDSLIDYSDVLVVTAHFGQPGPWDVDGSGQADMGDALLVMDCFGG